MSTRRAALRAFGLASALLVAACIGTDKYAPGTPLGTFAVTGTVTQNGCMSTPNPWSFAVKLSQDKTTLYWLTGNEPIQGTLDEKNHVAMTTSGDWSVVPGASDGGAALCTIERDDDLDATLTGTPFSAFTGTLTYTYRQTSDSTDCSSMMTNAGGTFAVLPCMLTYSLTAAKE